MFVLTCQNPVAIISNPHHIPEYERSHWGFCISRCVKMHVLSKLPHGFTSKEAPRQQLFQPKAEMTFPS